MAAPTILIPIDAGWTTELAARTALKKGDVHWKIEIDDDDDTIYTDFTAYLDNNQVGISAKGSVFMASGATQARLAFRNSPKVWSEGDLADAPVKISVSIGASSVIQIFAGFVDEKGAVRQKRKFIDDTVSLTMYDGSRRRGLKRKTEFTSYVGYDICDTVTTSESLVHALAAAMGLSAGDLDVNSIAYTKDYLPLAGNRTYWQELQDLAQQYFGILGFRYDGKLRLRTWTYAEWNAASPEFVLDDTNVHSFQAEKGGIACNKAITKFTIHEALPAGSVVYKSYENFNAYTQKNAIVVAAGEYWPGGTDEYAVARLQYGFKDEKYPVGTNITEPTIGLSALYDIQCMGGTLTLESWNGISGTTASKTSQNADSSEIILYNATGSAITIKKLEVRGTPLRELAEVRVEHMDATISNDWEYVEHQIPGTYAVGEAQAKITVARWIDYGKTPRKRYIADCDFLPHLQCGAIITFNPTADVNLDCYIEAYEHASRGSHGRTRTRVTLVEKDTYPSAGAGIPTHRFAEPSPQHASYDPIPPASDYFDLRYSDCIGDSADRRITPSKKRIVFFPGKLKDEFAEEYENLWAKFAGLGTVGCFKATTNLVTDPEDLIQWARDASVTTVASPFSWQGRPFVKVTGAAANTGAYRGVTFTGDGVKSVQILARKEDAVTDTRIVVYDVGAATSRMVININWATSAVTASTGGLVSAQWYDAGTIVEILGVTTSVTAANEHWVICRPSAGSASKIAYFTAAMAEDSIYPTPYTPTSRAISELAYPYSWAQNGAIEFWVRPWFSYNVATNKYFFADYNGAAWHIACFYDASVDQIKFMMYDGATTVTLTAGRSDAGGWGAANAFDSNTYLRVWMHIKCVWSNTDNEWALWINGAEIDSDTTALTTIAFEPYLSIGSIPYYTSPATFNADSFITDCLIRPTADVTTTHYSGGNPYFDIDDVINAYQRAAPAERLDNTTLALTDDRNRSVEISPTTGLMARDAAGTIIHDIPDAPILTDAFVMGHLYEFKFDNALYTLVNTATGKYGAWQTGITIVTAGIANARGARLKVYIAHTGSAGTNASAFIILRPTGSGWGSAISDMSAEDYTYLDVSGNTIIGFERAAILDVPVDSNKQFDYRVSGNPSGTTAVVTIQQLGVWL